jgi:surface antigen
MEIQKQYKNFKTGILILPNTRANMKKRPSPYDPFGGGGFRGIPGIDKIFRLCYLFFLTCQNHHWAFKLKILKIGGKVKLKAFSRLCLCIVVGSLLLFAAAGSSKKPGETDSYLLRDPEPVTSYGYYQAYKVNEFDLSFMYPSDWTIQHYNESEADGSLHTLVITGNLLETVAIKVFNQPEDVEGFIKSNVGSFAASGIEDIYAARSVISGCDGYSWIAKDRGKPIGGTVVFANEKYLYVLNFSGVFTSNVLAIDDLIHSISAGFEGPTELAFDVANIDYQEEASVLVATCCSLTDSYTNNYPCCATPGNCTWYCEYRISGSNSFPWYGDAYMWMYNARYNGTKTYPTGGTIPEVGAIMVFDSGWYTYGHVAYVTGINSNGSINVAEQGCDSYCTRSGSYSTSTLRSYLAGYIYVDGSTPGPSAKTISGTIGGSTIVDDYNFSSTYNFQAYGPGRNYGTYSYGWGTYNGGYNSWFHWTKTTSSQVCYGKWAIYIGTAGTYKVEAYIPSIHGTADNVRYYVDSTNVGSINQNNYYNQWVTAGSIYLSAGTHYVYVYDNLSGTSGKELAFDAIRVGRTS